MYGSVIETTTAMRQGKVSPREILEHYIAGIERLNPQLNAIVTLAYESARLEAEIAEETYRQETDGDFPPLLGVPILIKDIVETKGIRTTWASPIYANHIPNFDAEVVIRLRKAGAIILGKTNTPEFAAGANTDNKLFGPTRNPWNPELSASGSSGGK